MDNSGDPGAPVADFDATTRELCAFAGLDWSENLRDFAQTARRRGVAKASMLAPVMPILQPWVEKFGYES